jgi:hypothetical protein
MGRPAPQTEEKERDAYGQVVISQAAIGDLTRVKGIEYEVVAVETHEARPNTRRVMDEVGIIDEVYLMRLAGTRVYSVKRMLNGAISQPMKVC